MQRSALERPIVVWIAGLAGSIAIISASMVFVADAATKFLTPVAAATASSHRPVARLADSVAETFRPPAAVALAPTKVQVVNGPPAPFVTTAVAVPPAALQANRPEETIAPRHMIVATGSLNVRAEPSGKAAKVGALRRGTAVTIIDRLGTWTRIADASGAEGWVYSKFLAVP